MKAFLLLFFLILYSCGVDESHPKEFTYNGCTYLEFHSYSYKYTTVVHSPNCTNHKLQKDTLEINKQEVSVLRDSLLTYNYIRFKKAIDSINYNK